MGCITHHDACDCRQEKWLELLAAAKAANWGVGAEEQHELEHAIQAIEEMLHGNGSD